MSTPTSFRSLILFAVGGVWVRRKAYKCRSRGVLPVVAGRSLGGGNPCKDRALRRGSVFGLLVCNAY